MHSIPLDESERIASSSQLIGELARLFELASLRRFARAAGVENLPAQFLGSEKDSWSMALQRAAAQRRLAQVLRLALDESNGNPVIRRAVEQLESGFAPSADAPPKRADPILPHLVTTLLRVVSAIIGAVVAGLTLYFIFLAVPDPIRCGLPVISSPAARSVSRCATPTPSPVPSTTPSPLKSAQRTSLRRQVTDAIAYAIEPIKDRTPSTKQSSQISSILI